MKPFLRCAAVAATLIPSIGLAADGTMTTGGWQHRAAIYLWGAGLDGESGNKLSSGDIEASFSDILSNLSAGFMGNYRGKKDRYSVNLDVIYLGISPNPKVKGPNPLPVGPRQIDTKADSDVTKWIVDLTAGYEVLPGLEFLAGARYVNLDIQAKVDLPGSNTLKVGGNEDWLDPIVGFHWAGYFPNSKKWRYSTRGDIGGFGVGSDLTWQAYGFIGYEPTRNWVLFAGYRHLYMDYDSGNDNGFFYDMAISGPMAGAGYQF